MRAYFGFGPLSQSNSLRRIVLSVAFVTGLMGAGRFAIATEVLSATAPQIDFTAFGPGVWSCATWLATPAQERDGANWILGFFTAANLSGGDDRDVGGKAGSSEIVAAVKAKCVDDPKTRMGEATGRVYKELQRTGK